MKDNPREVFMGLWPKVAANMTDEQWGVWQEIWDSAPRNADVAVMLRALAKEKTYPRPKDLYDMVMGAKRAGQPRSTPERPAGSSLVNTLREQRAYGHLLRGMNDQRILALHACWEYRMALSLYGPGPLSDGDDPHPIGTVAAYFRWQRAIGAWDGSDVDIPEYIRRGMDRVHHDTMRPTFNQIIEEAAA